MSFEKKEFQDLGFDLLGLDKLVYFTNLPEEPGGDTCVDGKCTVSCTNGCASCSPGNKN